MSTKDRRLMVRMSEAEYRALLAEAQRHDMPTSTFLRRVVRDIAAGKIQYQPLEVKTNAGN